MKRSRICQLALAATSVLAAGLAAAPAGASNSSGDSAAPSFQEFEASTYRDLDTQYVVNGDEPESSTGSLRQFYDRMISTDDSKKTDEDALIVNRVAGQDDKWSASQALNLTYCVSTKFGASQTNVINAMNQGAALWESASSKVNFVYVPSANSNCTTRNNAVLFSVEPTNTTQYIARAFFPSTADRSRNVLVNATSLMNSGSWTPGNILGHELGHSLGFRHEHTRPEAGTCFEDNNWRPLTPYDSASIMHYPQCNGTSDDLSFTSSDGAGIRALYGS
jgi:hypothetical protein